jgi:hypothetical protein
MLTRIAPALGLFFLSPFVAETIDLIGNSVFSLVVVVLLASAARAVARGEITSHDMGGDF